jgi:hypothetical protein
LARCLVGVRAAEDPLLLSRPNRNIAGMSDIDATKTVARDPRLSRTSTKCVHLASAEALNLRPRQSMMLRPKAACAHRPIGHHQGEGPAPAKDALRRVRYRRQENFENTAKMGAECA